MRSACWRQQSHTTLHCCQGVRGFGILIIGSPLEAVRQQDPQCKIGGATRDEVNILNCIGLPEPMLSKAIAEAGDQLGYTLVENLQADVPEGGRVIVELEGQG